MNASADCKTVDCPVCTEVFKEPKIIPCGHVICRLCLVLWLEARDMQAGCPLCRYPIFDLQIPGYPIRVIAETVADALPTDVEIKATALERQVTSETCLGCAGLICPLRSTPSPLCPGSQDPQETVRREAAARASLEALSTKVEEMLHQTLKMQVYLKSTEEEFRSQVAQNNAVAQMKVKAVDLVLKVQGQIAELRTVLITHKHLFERVQVSSESVVPISMSEPMKDRVNFLMRRLKNVEQGYLEESRKLCESSRRNEQR